ncbi:MAG: hypothetical protein KA369_10755 [Spirochaetes bacterium]|nr:hypothetical protein [Spirochaetota bacterium]
MSKCEHCKFRNYSEKNPEKLISRIWKWHTTWCPGWKKYQRELRKSEFSCCQGMTCAEK